MGKGKRMKSRGHKRRGKHLKVVDKAKFIRGITIIILGLVMIITLIVMLIKGMIFLVTKPKEETKKPQTTSQETQQITQENTVPVSVETTPNQNAEIVNEWNLKLVNKDNSVDRSYIPELEEIDDGIKFDKRAIGYLKSMMSAMYQDGITKIWVQSAYRSYEKQEQLFKNKVTYYKNKGKDQEEAERLAQTVVQRPEMSEHNLGLAADFNTVTNEFEETKAFEWLQEHAADYGFILRYPKDKQDITGITYESWHWRYVGKEHAKAMKERGYCLEEYINDLKGGQTAI